VADLLAGHELLLHLIGREAEVADALLGDIADELAELGVLVLRD